MIRLRFDIEPVAKQRPRVTKTHTYTPKKTKQYEDTIKLMAKIQMGRRKPLGGALSVFVTFNLLKPKSVKRSLPCVRCDLDNFLKAVLDSLNGIVWKDDGQIVSLVAHKIYAIKKPHITMLIERVT